jgi:predicted O-methyltransferase YrrM
MLPLRVYEAIFAAASSAPGPTFVEIGTGHGASAIALALGAKSAGMNVHVHTVDQLVGRYSSRTRFGSIETNREIIQRNFRDCGIQKHVSLYVGSSEDFASSTLCPKQIHLLLLDADGRIDRDLLQFGDALVDGAVIIIDDVDDSVSVGKDSTGAYFIDLKHRISYLLLRMLLDNGYLTIERRLDNTVFCRRGKRSIRKCDLERLVLGPYRELVFSSIGERELRRHVIASANQARSLRLLMKGFRAVRRTVGRLVHRRSGGERISGV